VDTAGRRQRTRTEEESRGEQRVSKKNPTNRNTRTEGKRLRGGGRENSPGVLELLLSPAPSNRQVRLPFYLRFCTFFYCKRRARGEGNLITFALCSARVVWTTCACSPAGSRAWASDGAGPGWLGPA
jgi:hypothetical protein